MLLADVVYNKCASCI